MPSEKPCMHLVNENGAIICPRKTSPHKVRRELWDKLPDAERCGNCKRVLARKEGRERVNFGTATVYRKKTVTDDPRASYTHRYGILK